MAISYGQFTLWVSVSYVVKSEPSCTSHKPRASYQRWLVRGDLQHEICPHAATQSYVLKSFCSQGGKGLHVPLPSVVIVFREISLPPLSLTVP